MGLKFETVPARVGLNIVRDTLLTANDGKLIISPADAEKTCAIGPGWNGCIGRKPGHSVDAPKEP
ncbi:hypothetical protein C241_21272 [Bradyrhizobium lupini HPC(L)]|uniref:Uncharacterized protein n=1 Tax=Bradyrhizobium lupini HPC(L) TaxID=1229491 RepID=A0ABP2RNF6_RHILU|nr:hypothetical protein C241_21272 [Bradyrhizobium lupini HPC(L)]